MKKGFSVFSGFLGILCAFCLMIIFLITSVEAVAYWTPGYYEKEYSKYHVTEAVHMEMEDLLAVTDEMMDYLRGDRADLHVETVVNGEPREFFNAREIAHMEDVRGLFLGGLALRRACLLLAAACVAALFALRAPVRSLLPRMLCAGTVLFLAVTALLAAVISTDFTKYFILFHRIFFTNDLWMLDPATDLLINIVPEPFFMDTAARIALTFAALTALLFAVCAALILLEKRQKQKTDRPKKTAARKGAALLLLVSLTLARPLPAQASTDWPSGVSIESDAGIVMDSHTGTVLYGKNIHDTYAPASITKVLTAILVLENCSMDEIVTFSENAVYNVESNSSSAGYDTGDTASVKDCLYALLLKSANEAANALAEHVAGTTEDFAVLMNEKAAELGCVDSHFSNPSGLNDENHYVSAYDMALITRAAFQYDAFAEIISTTYYELPPNKLNPEGQGISPGNKMVKKNWPDEYRPDVLGGKTGYTSIALNTLVNGARQGDTELITVVLHSHGTQYTDTDRLLDFGFQNFHSVKIADYDQTFSSIGDELEIGGFPTSEDQRLALDPDSRLILPVTADFSETTSSLSYEIPAGAPEGTIAAIDYYLGDHLVGQAFLTLTDAAVQSARLPESLLEAAPTAIAPAESASPVSEEAADETVSPVSGEESGPFHISLRLPSLALKIAGAVLILVIAGGGIYTILEKKRRQEEEALLERRRRRAQRLRETGVSQAEFDLMMQKRRESSGPARSGRSRAAASRRKKGGTRP